MIHKKTKRMPQKDKDNEQKYWDDEYDDEYDEEFFGQIIMKQLREDLIVSENKKQKKSRRY